jgi:large subunit ribosomal protein L10e
MYRKVEGQVYTRKEYMGGIPHCRVTQFDTGNVHQVYRHHCTILTKEAGQVRDQSLEAARVAIVREMERVASNNFHLKVSKYPHNILREHKMATGAGADRISDGMRLAFGKHVGHAVRANIGDKLYTLSFRSENLDAAREAVRKAACKLPMPVSAVFSEDVNVVEGPRAAPIVIEPAPEKPAEAAPAEGEAPAEPGKAGEAKPGEKPEAGKPAAGKPAAEAAPAKTPLPAKPKYGKK